MGFIIQFTQHPFTALLALSALGSGCITFLIWTKRTLKGAPVLVALMFELTIWAGAYVMMWSSPMLDTQVFWLNTTYFGVLTIPITFLIFTMQITDHDHWLTKRHILLLCIEPLIAFFAIWTNQFHYLFHSSYKMNFDNGFLELFWTRGPLFWVSAAYSYILIIVAVAILARAYMQAGPYFRAQLGTVLMGCVPPLGTNLYALFIPNSSNNLDLTPISFTLSGAIFTYALLKQGLLDILPVARSALIDIIPDGMLVLDMQGRILDVNPAAERFFSADGSIHGRNIRDVFPQWNELVEKILTEKTFYQDVQRKTNPLAFYGLAVAPLMDRRGRENGRLIIFRDISEQKRSKDELEKMNGRLTEQVEKISALHDELREQAIRDPLTGLFNRRYLTETLERELNLAKRKGYAVSIIMMDIDQFKKVNDTHGHKEGDRVLEALGNIIQSHVRLSDIPCRFGGEEFVIVMPETTIETAAQRAGQIRTKFCSMNFFPEKNCIIPTLSIGVAAFPVHGDHLENILNSADQAMYLAKTVRNTVVIYGDKPAKSHSR